MRILRILTVISILYLVFIFFTWQTSKPISPKEAFLQTKHAYQTHNAKKILELLSKNSIKNIKKAINSIESMTPAARQSFSKKLGLNNRKLANLSVEDFILIQLKLNKIHNSDIYTAFNTNIVSIKEYKNKAIVQTENNIELLFVKNGPYWLFDLANN